LINKINLKEKDIQEAEEFDCTQKNVNEFNIMDKP
jgi:hypothetical protein